MSCLWISEFGMSNWSAECGVRRQRFLEGFLSLTHRLYMPPEDETKDLQATSFSTLGLSTVPAMYTCHSPFPKWDYALRDVDREPGANVLAPTPAAVDSSTVKPMFLPLLAAEMLWRA
ncbi:hypothetical protein CT0861_05418, partial [Colletotrichum tofieldiae]